MQELWIPMDTTTVTWKRGIDKHLSA